MQKDNGNKAEQSTQQDLRGKKPYCAPVLQKFGSVQTLTQSGGSSKTTDSKTTKAKASDQRAKTNVVRVGTHPLGFGLYLFDYLPAFAVAADQQGRQFGVLAQEVEPVVPSAVSTDVDGYRRVNYQQLGIVLH